MTECSLEGVSHGPAYLPQHGTLESKQAHDISGAGKGVQSRTPGLQEDLGDELQIDAMLERLAKGRLVPGVQAFRSGASLSDGASQEHVHLHGRSVLKSRKNLQLQVV